MTLCGGSSSSLLCGLSLTLLLFCTLVLSPWAIWRFTQLWVRQKEVQLLHVRRLTFDAVPVACVSAFVCIVVPLHSLSSAEVIGHYQGIRFLTGISLLSCAVSALFKTLITHSDLTFARITKEHSWMALLRSDEEPSSVYFKWRNTWLGPRRLSLICGSYFIIAALANTVGFILHGMALATLINILFVVPMTGLVIGLWFSTPSITDSCGIRREIKLISIITLIGMVGFVLLFAFMAWMRTLDSLFHRTMRLLVYWLDLLAILYVWTEHRWRMLPMMVREWSTIDRIKSGNGWMMNSSSMIRPMMVNDRSNEPSTMISIHRLSTMTKKSKSQETIKSIESYICDDLLSQSDTVTLFSDFLISEMSIENLIGLMEWLQFLEEMPDNIEDPLLGSIHVDHSAIPRSALVSSAHSSVSVAFRLLFERYICDSTATLRLNLPFPIVYDCHRLLEADEQGSCEDPAKYIAVCTAVIRECFKLLRDSFIRFQQTPEFGQFMALCQ